METTRLVFSKRLRKYRQYLGYSQREMAQRLGIVKSTLVGWEKVDGHGQPTWEQLDKMCSWTGIEPIFFLITEDFGSDYIDAAEHIKGLPPQVRDALLTLIWHTVKTNLGVKDPAATP